MTRPAHCGHSRVEQTLRCNFAEADFLRVAAFLVISISARSRLSLRLYIGASSNDHKLNKPNFKSHFRAKDSLERIEQNGGEMAKLLKVC